MNQMQTIIRRAKREDKLNILTFPTHERYETSLAKTGHNFYAYRTEKMKKWNTNYGPVPKNYTLLEYNKLPLWLEPDMVLCQNKTTQFQASSELATKYGIPLISLEHTLPHHGAPLDYITKMASLQGDIDVFVSPYQRKSWGFPENHGYVNMTGIDTEFFVNKNMNRNDVALSVVNDWINRDIYCGYYLWREIIKDGDIPVRVVGDTPGLSQAASGPTELVNIYNSCSVYLNTTIMSSLPTVILEAMACGCAVVSTATCMIPDNIIEHGVNGFVSNDINELKLYTKQLLADDKLARKIGNAARKKIIEEFSLERFTNKWNQIFEDASTRKR